MIAAKQYICTHMEKYCGPIQCLPEDVRTGFTGYTSTSIGKTQRFYFSVFCARNHIPCELCLAYMKVFGLNRSSFDVNHARRIYLEASKGDHQEYYSYICGRNTCVDPVKGEEIEARFMVGKTCSYRMYELQRNNTSRPVDVSSADGYRFSA